MAGSQYGSPPFNGSRGRPALLRGPSYGIARRGAAENDPVLPVHGAHGPTCLSTGRHCSAGSGPRTGVHTHVTRTRGRHLHRKIAFEPKTLDCATLPSGACRKQIGRAHVLTPVTNAHLVCRLLLEKKNKKISSTTP